MGFLSTLSDIGSGAASVGTIVGAAKGVGGLLGFGGNQQKMQYKYQKKLMYYQNQLNQQNATIDYNRQRQLTTDNALLQKIGMRQAGQNTALGDGSVGSAASTGSIDPTSTPSALPTDSQVDSQYASMVTSSAAQLGSLALQRSQIGLIDSQKRNQDIKNMTQLSRDIAEKGMMSSQAAKNFKEATYQGFVNDVAQSRLASEAESAASIARINEAEAAARGPMIQAKYDNLMQDLENKRSQKKLTDQEYNTEVEKLNLMRSEELRNNAAAADSASHVGVNDSQSRLNTLNGDFVDKGMSDNLAILKSERVRKWYDAQPQNIQQVVMSSAPVREAVNKVVQGKTLTYSDWVALVGAFGYEKGGDIVTTLADLTPAGAASKVVKSAGDAYKSVKRKIQAKPHPTPAWKRY